MADLLTQLVAKIDSLERRLDRLAAVENVAASTLNAFHVSEVWESDDGAAALVADASGNLALNGSRILSIGTSDTSYDFEAATTTPDLYILGKDTAAVRTAAFARNSDTAARAPQNAFIRASAAGGAVSDNWRVGQFSFSGHDGTDYNQGAVIRVEVDGTVAANTVPMRLIFLTSEDKSTGLAERLVIAPNGLITFNNDLILAGGTQSYEVSSRASALTLSSQAAADDNILELYTNDGDGTDFCGINLYAVGTRTAITNRERLQIRYTPGSTLFEIFTEADGAGTTLRPLVLYTEGNSNQLYLDTSGQVGLSVTPSTRLDIGAGAMEFNEMTAPGAGAANTARLYAVDNGAGKTQLVVIFSSGAAQVLATQP